MRADIRGNDWFQDLVDSVWDCATNGQPCPLTPEQREDLSADQLQTLKMVAERARLRSKSLGPTRFPPGWKVIRRIGSGGGATVYECEEPESTGRTRTVAVKVLRRSTAEASVTADTEHVIAVYRQLMFPSGHDAIVMQLALRTLSDDIKDSPHGLSPDNLRHAMLGTAKGMKGLADKGIIHRDLKPSNILFTKDDFVKVSDFGLAIKQTTLEEEKSGFDVVGTPEYMSPEQATNPKAVDEQSDIYSFGATFYHAWTGRPPFKWTGDFERLIREHDTGSLPAIESVRPGLAPALADLIERCLAKHPKDRVQSFEEVVEILEGRRDSNRKQSPEFSRFVKQATELLGSGHTEHGTSETFPVPMSSTVRKITVVTGDLTKIAEGVDAIVSADDHRLSMGGGVSEAISEWAGPRYEEIAKLTDRLTPGTSVVTPMPQRGDCRYVIQGITRYKGNRDFEPTVDLVRQIMNSCRPHILALGIKRIAFPLLGTGWGRLSSDDCLQTMCEQAVDLLSDGSLPLNDCRIVIFNK